MASGNHFFSREKAAAAWCAQPPGPLRPWWPRRTEYRFGAQPISAGGGSNKAQKGVVDKKKKKKQDSDDEVRVHERGSLRAIASDSERARAPWRVHMIESERAGLVMRARAQDDVAFKAKQKAEQQARKEMAKRLQK